MKPWILMPWFAVATAMALEPKITAELQLREAYLGDPIPYTIRVQYEPGWQFETLALPEKLGQARVLLQDWRTLPRADGAALDLVEFRAQLAFYRLGSFKVPPVTLVGVDEDGSRHEFATPELAIEIINMLGEDDQDLAPGKGQVDMEAPPLWPFLVAAAVLLVLAVWLLRRFIRRRGQGPAPETVPVKPPYEEAIDRLNELTHGSLLKEGKVKAFHVEINQIIRHYYGRLWHIHAEEMTSFEMEAWLEARTDLPEGLLTLNRNFQERCDLVKFAKHDPLGAENKELVNWAYEIVEILKPKPREETHVAAG